MFYSFLGSHAWLCLHLFHATFDDTCQFVSLLQFQNPVPSACTHADGHPSWHSFDNCFHNSKWLEVLQCKGTHIPPIFQDHIQKTIRQITEVPTDVELHNSFVLSSTYSTFDFVVIAKHLQSEAAQEGSFARKNSNKFCFVLT